KECAGGGGGLTRAGVAISHEVEGSLALGQDSQIGLFVRDILKQIQRSTMPSFELWIGNLARQIVRRLVQVYYSDIEVTDPERIPPTGPALFVANHANSLIDPVIIGISVRRP